LTRYDAASRSLAGAFDFTQRPLSPLVQRTRACRAGGANLDQRFTGTIVRLRLRSAFSTVTIRLSPQEIGTMQILTSTRFETSDHLSISARQLRPGDSVDVVARPQPERALFFTLGSLLDRDLTYQRSLQGVVSGLDPSTHQFVLHRSGATDVLVDLQRGTAIFRSGQRVGLPDLLNGQRVAVAGVINGRSHEIVRTDRIDIQSGAG
jgi:hypothetical protein